MNSPEVVEKPADSKPQPANLQTEAFLSKAINTEYYKIKANYLKY